MAEYKRYQKLQKYYLGVPVEPAEYKEGELIGIKDYNSIEECEQDTPQITYNNWVTTTSDFLLENNGFTINSLGQDDDGYYHSTIEGAGTTLLFRAESLIYSHFIDLSNFTNLRNLFYNNYDYIGGNFTGWNTSNVTDMSYMFYSCHSLKTLDLSSFDTRNVSNVMRMFFYCNSLKELNISGWDLTNAYNDKYSSEMFLNCTSLQTIYAYNCNEATITMLNKELIKADLTNKVTIITQ